MTLVFTLFYISTKMNWFRANFRLFLMDLHVLGSPDQYLTISGKRLSVSLRVYVLVTKILLKVYLEIKCI